MAQETDEGQNYEDLAQEALANGDTPAAHVFALLGVAASIREAASELAEAIGVVFEEGEEPAEADEVDEVEGD